jgi:mRNA interferase MazF
VLSPEAYNRKTSLFLACPVTSQVKGYPFEVALPAGLPVSGVILADQIKSLEFLRLQEELEDYEDLKTIREERALAEHEPSRSLDDILRKTPD